MASRLSRDLLIVTLLSPLLAFAAGPVDVTSIVLDPFTPNTLYASTSDRGVFRSTNGGATWSPTGLTNTPVIALAIDPGAPSFLYAATPLGVLKSSDAGNTWAFTGLMNDQISGYSYFFPYQPVVGTVGSVAVAPRTDPKLPATLYVGATYVAYDAFTEFVWGEVLGSPDGGSGWGPVVPAVSGDPYAFPAWRSAPILTVARPNPATAAVVYTSGSYEYDLCWVSDPGGTIDGCAVLGHTFVGASAFAVDPQNPNIVYAGTNGSGVYKSTNGGAGWSNGTSGAVKSLAIDPRTPSNVYAGTGDRGVLKSADGGATWTAVNSGLTNHLEALGVHAGVRVVALDPIAPATVYAGTVAGVFKSTDAGENWSLSGHPTLVSLRVNPDIVIRGTASTGTVILNAAAPEGGAVVELSSNETAAASVPGSVTVTAGATSANFAISTGPLSRLPVTISATHDDLARSAALFVVPALSNAALNPYRVPGGIASSGTVWLSLPPSADGAVVSLSSSNAALAAVPVAVTVAAGATSASFAVSSSAVAESTTVMITAAYGGDARLMALELVPTTVSSVSLSPASVTAGSASIGTVALTVPAPVGGAVVRLSKSGSSASLSVVAVPASVTVPAGKTSATFTISTSPVLPPTYSGIAVSVEAAHGGATASRGLTVTQRP
jgi:hypothetical protein